MNKIPTFLAIVFILALNSPYLFPQSHTPSHKQPSDSVRAANSQRLDSLEYLVVTLRSDLDHLEVSKDYFSSILNSQTVIFSTIVFVLMASTWVFSYLKVENSISKKMKKVQADLLCWKNVIAVTNAEMIEQKSAESQKTLKNLNADISRAFASMNEKSPQVSFIWWLRAASEYTIENHSLIQVALNRAHEALTQIKYKFEIEPWLSEVSTILDSLDQKSFGVALTGIRDEIQRVYKSSPVSPGGAV